MKKLKFDVKAAYSFFKEKNYSNITQCTKDYCNENNIVYSDSYRRVLSNCISKGTEIKRTEVTNAKVLILDIETAPLESYVWGVWNQNIGTNLDMVKSDWFILTWSAKWLFDDCMISNKLSKGEALKEDDSRIVGILWTLLNQADVIIAHNANKFDVKKMNSRFILNGLRPPTNYEVIDTLAHARKRFSMTSNKLDYLAKLLGVGKKIEHEGFNLWKKCRQGNEEALSTMSKYNDGDVLLLEEVYLKMRPWIKPHPNMGLHVVEDLQVCPSCGSSELKWEGTAYRTYVNEYPTCICLSCGAESRSRKAITSKSMNKNLLVSLPR